MDDLTKARADATQEVCASILKAAGEAMQRHGNDPQSGVIVAAGFAHALRMIGENIDPTVPIVVREMLDPAGARIR